MRQGLPTENARVTENASGYGGCMEYGRLHGIRRGFSRGEKSVEEDV